MEHSCHRSNYTVGIKTDGTLWAWGLNDKGQLGMSGGDKDKPTEVKEAPSIK